MIYLFTYEFENIHFFYVDGYIYLHNIGAGIYTQWQWDEKLIYDGTANDVDCTHNEFSYTLPKILVYEYLKHETLLFYRNLHKYITSHIYEKLL